MLFVLHWLNKPSCVWILIATNPFMISAVSCIHRFLYDRFTHIREAQRV
jgi:hypothetical protein